MPKAPKSKKASQGDRPTPYPPSAASNGNTTRQESPAACKPKVPDTLTLPNPGANHLLQVRVFGTFEPTVERLLSIPPHYTFAQVHKIIQISFGWIDHHAHLFNVSLAGDKSYYPKDLLCILPTTMRMYDRYDNCKEIVETDITLAEVYDSPRFEGRAKITYKYDFGDGWQHDFALIGRAGPGLNQQLRVPDAVNVLCLAGSGHPIAEDSGGVCGWEDLKDRFAKPERNDEGDRKTWYRTYCANGDADGLNPYKWDIVKVNQKLKRTFSRAI